MDPEIKEAVRRFNAAAENFDSFQTRLAELESKGAVIRGSTEPRPGLAKQLAGAAEFKAAVSGHARHYRGVFENISIKSLLGSTAFPPTGSPTSTIAPEATRDPRLYGYAMRPIRLLDVLPSIPIATGTFEYVRLNGYTNIADYQQNEGDRKSESGVATSLETAKAHVIAHWLPVSRQVLADYPSLETQLRMLLSHGVLDRAERELVNGSGAGSISGLLTEGTAYVGSARNRADLLGQAASAMSEVGYTPTHIVLAPSDWFGIQSRAATDGQYILGSAAQPLAASLWGLPIVTTPALAAGTGIVLDATKVLLLDRQSVTVELGMVEAQFVENCVSILAETRIGLAVLDAGAVRTVSFAGSPSIT